jgi:CBS domain-containing protein
LVVTSLAGPAGIITERDFVNPVVDAQDPASVSVAERMSTNLITVSPATDAAARRTSWRSTTFDTYRWSIRAGSWALSSAEFDVFGRAPRSSADKPVFAKVAVGRTSFHNWPRNAATDIQRQSPGFRPRS